MQIRPRVLACTGLFGLLVGGLASAAYQALGEARDRRRFPPPGEPVDIDGRRLHLWRADEGGPAVVIATPLGEPAYGWADMQRRLAQHTTVVLYDRAALGWSDPGPWPTGKRIVDDLHALLHAATIPPPYVLVGHSIGGLHVRLYAAHDPEQVAGLVLVDSSPQPVAPAPPALRRLAAFPAGALAPGCQARVPPARAGPAARPPPHPVRPWRRHRGPTAGHPAGAGRGGRSDGAQLPAASRGRPGDARVLQRGRRGIPHGCWQARQPWTAPTDRDHQRHQGSPSLACVCRGRLAGAQAELALLSERGTHLHAESGDHFVHRSDPDLVVRAIADLVDQVRATA